MKGLLLKDWYSIIANFRYFVFLLLIFIAASCFGGNNTFFLFYPCILSGMIAMSLIAFEEKEKWDVYEETLPYSRSQIVSAKYIISLIMSLATIIIILTVQTGMMIYKGTFHIAEIIDLSIPLFIFSFLPTMLLLPFIYKFGCQKGRIVYYFILGFFFALIGLYSALSGNNLVIHMEHPLYRVLTFMILALAFISSWLLSVHFYKKKEIY